MLLKLINPKLYATKTSIIVCADIELFKAKVPCICPSIAGVLVRREGLYLHT